MIVGIKIVQYLLIMVEVVDGGSTIVQTYTLTVSTTTNMQCISMISGIHYHLWR